ncbi:hypothetical protein Btru_003211 [Bulinus truncatus]|nr:hypothetical protein Btru_003211 [Bulinus truncatus]
MKYLFSWFISDEPVKMSLGGADTFTYIKEPASGTLQFSVDSNTFVSFTFYERIHIEVFLNSLHPIPSRHCQIEKRGVNDEQNIKNADHESKLNSSLVDLDEPCSSNTDLDCSEIGCETNVVSDNTILQNCLSSPDTSHEIETALDENTGNVSAFTNKMEDSGIINQQKANASNRPQRRRTKTNTKMMRLKTKANNCQNNAVKKGCKKNELMSCASNIMIKKFHGKKISKWKDTSEISCPYCLSIFQTQQAFFDHKKTVRSNNFQCKFCPKAFPFKAYLQAHLKTSHCKVGLGGVKDPDTHKCDFCGIESKNVLAFKKHLMTHTEEYFYQCCMCKKQFVEPGSLNNHMNTHRSGGMIRCKCCNQLFATRGALAKHKLALMEVKCHMCDEIFPNRTSRTQHYKLFHQSDILKCLHCTHMFSSQEELAAHMKKHAMYKKKQCTICGKFFSRLEKHVIIHKSKSEIDESLLFVCDKCPRKFSHRSSFQRHLSTHSLDKPYQCPNCPRTFADCSVLRKHIQRHTFLMPYQCEVCGKKCKELGNLKVHMRIHSDSKPFSCSICFQAFNYKSSLEGHVKSRHPCTTLRADHPTGELSDPTHIHHVSDAQDFPQGQLFNVGITQGIEGHPISEAHQTQEVDCRFSSETQSHYSKQQEALDKHFYNTGNQNSKDTHEEKKEGYCLLPAHQVFHNPASHSVEADGGQAKLNFLGETCLSSSYINTVP